MEDGIIVIMKPAKFYGGAGDSDVNFGEAPSNKAEVIRDIFANADGKQKDREDDGISFGELWKRNGNNNLYLLGALMDSALIEERDDSEEWVAVLSTNELASIAVKHPSRHTQKKRKSDMDWQKQDTFPFSQSTLDGIMKNGWDPSNHMKGSGSQPGLDDDKEVLKALMRTSNRVNGGNGGAMFPWNAPGNQDGGGLLLLSRGQWKTLAHSAYSFQTSVIGGAQAWLKKIFRNAEEGGERTCCSKDMRDSSASSLRKWVSIKYISKRKGKQVDHKKNKATASMNPERIKPFPGGSIRIDISRDWEQIRKQDGMMMSSFEDFLLEETLNLYYEGDMIKIRVTMFCKPEVSSCSQLEIDLVQSFVCETETDRCRRRIAKVLKRDLVTDFIWEKGVTSSGIYFSIYCTHFEIPKIFPLELESSLEKFRISNFEYELRLRFFCEDELGQTATSACSFPLNICGDMSSDEMFAEVADA